MSQPRLDVLYRGPLSSCNYDCSYCPFAKRQSTRADLRVDRAALERFVCWVERLAGRTLGVLFTPWGEALIRRHYREAMVRLSHLEHVANVCIQTNLSCGLGWVRDARLDRLSLWATFHPGQTSHERFVAKSRFLLEHGVSFSVGIVGLARHLAAAEALRAALPPEVYVWVNAAKSSPEPAAPDILRRFAEIDPLFRFSALRHPSAGRVCRTGERIISVDGAGDVRRCHFVPTVLGNLYRDPLEGILGERVCPNATCGCHIGYVHLDHLGLRDVFGRGLLARIPESKRAPQRLPHAEERDVVLEEDLR